MFGFEDVASFTHEVEAVFDLVRNEKISVTKQLVDLTLASKDLIRGMLDSCETGGAQKIERAGEIVDALKSFLPDASAPMPTERSDQGAPPAREPSPPSAGKTYGIHFAPHSDLFRTGTNPVLLLDELRSLGPCSLLAELDEIPPLDAMDPELCYTRWAVSLTTPATEEDIRSVFIFVEDDCQLSIQVAHARGTSGEDEPAVEKKLGQILMEQGHITSEALSTALGGQKRLGEILVEEGLVAPGTVESALAEQRRQRELKEKRQTEEQASSVRVPAEKLDRLVDLVGELVTVQARLTQMAEVDLDPELVSIAEEVEALTGELRDSTMSIRMLPIGTTFNKFRRLVRDLSNELGKDVNLMTEGGDTELDKTVIERLNDPLVHLVRNSIDHGIEAPAVREATGKGRQGTVQLSAAHSGAHVLISIRDDGAGLDRDRIRSKAVEKGLLGPDEELSDKEIFSQIFAPGFSTAGQVTNVSGRGVGMDVVKRSIDALRGSIEIGSEKGRGTTFTLKLPLTLAIIDGLLVQLGASYFVMPLSTVEECIELTREDVSRAHGRNLAYLRGEIVPYIRLRERFGVLGEPPEIEQIVITEAVEGRVGFVVDKVIGEHQTVIKNLGRMYRHVEGISGATILGDGTVALILDIAHLVRDVELGEALIGERSPGTES
jgi:two-component system chemotaxis sensor kinase CheA